MDMLARLSVATTVFNLSTILIGNKNLLYGVQRVF